MILGLDAGSRTVPEAEHLLRHVLDSLELTDGAEAPGGPAGIVGCTHFVRTATGLPHVALSLDLGATAPGGPPRLPEPPDGLGAALGGRRAGPGALAEGAALAAAEHAARSGGRLVVYPGHEALTGTLTVAELLDRSAIERVAVLAHAGDPEPGTPVVTQGFVRPQWRDGRIVLLTMPAIGGALMPAEVPDPTPCCADHA
ncbi:hypothetical protein Skr01_59960 [Sphaerisporangium krabiense]|nr:hypothetical protein [Sphaerisporangium krabiense]GII65911.1 hypothetical protein Skr01_59960 [Sphaerisporangium krabiense]